MKVYQYYKELPPWAKGVVVVGGALGVFIVGKKLYSLVFPSIEQKRDKELLKDINSEIAKLQQVQKASYPDSLYITLANTIYNGMKYAVGDDYSAVQDSLKKMKNDLDVAKLVRAFGKRTSYAFGIPFGDYDLFTFVRKELGNEFLGLTAYRVTDINKNWASKKITYTI